MTPESDSNLIPAQHAQGEIGPEAGRFVVLRHDWKVPHHDLIVDFRPELAQSHLPTWALYVEGPFESMPFSQRPCQGRAVPLAPHRREYLTYEGPVSGGRGQVRRNCWGTVLGWHDDRKSPCFSIDLEVTGPAETIVRGRLSFRRLPDDSPLRDIELGPNHAGDRDMPESFEWRPLMTT